MAYYEADTAWHTGEQEMQKLLRVPPLDNPTQPYLTPQASNTLIRAPLIALGTLDEEGRPWTTLWGGEAGFSRAIAQGIIGVRTTIDREHDPVVKVLLGDKSDGEVMQVQGKGKMVSGLTINLETRNRVKLYGRMVAGAFAAMDDRIGEVQLVLKIKQSLGNCPKYLNKKHIVPHIPKPKLISSNLLLTPAAVALLAKADLFFISSSNHESDMDCNHRGGPPGFVRVLSNEEGEVTLIYPEYSGNRLYQTLGNLRTTPRAGLVIPDFETGNVLYLTGTTEILVGKDAADAISHSNLAVKIRVEAMRFVEDGLAFRGHDGEFSPYNPPVRYLSTEISNGVAGTDKQIHAKLIDKKIITPTIATFRFKITDLAKTSKWEPGQYVALSFADELGLGYSHMRDDDPKSLNDDFLRTFTVSSRQDAKDGNDQFEITIRNVGVVTDYLFKFNVRAELEVPIQGFGGDFKVEQGEGENIAFVAGGVGITPLLAQDQDLDLARLHLFWTNRADDIPLLMDTFDRIPGLAATTTVFITGNINAESEEWMKLLSSGAKIEKRRMAVEDVRSYSAEKWYLCTGTTFRASLLKWLEGKTVIFEEFNY